MKKFKNTPNIEHKVDGKSIWQSRSVAVVGTIMIRIGEEIFVLVSKRGKAALDEKGKWNLTCGYLDYDETIQEAIERELWEETGLDLDILRPNLIYSKLDQPWRIHSKPDANRQNVSCHFGCLAEVDKLPELSLENNEIEGEVESAIWLPIDDVNKYDWAFNHNEIISLFLSEILKEKLS